MAEPAPPGPFEIQEPPPAGDSSSSFAVFAYRRGEPDDDNYLRRERLPDWQPAVRWAFERGCDTIVVEAMKERPFHPEIVHHLCRDPGCPGGCSS